MSCQFTGCEFLDQPNMRELEGLSGLFRTRYCNADHNNCARYRVYRSFGSGAVPAEMRPNDQTSANKLLDKAIGG